MFSEFEFPEFHLLLATEDIRQTKEWRVNDDRHHFIVHLGGQMNSLETEIEGHAGCVGPAVTGEIWTVPAEHSYRSQATGGDIHYAVLSMCSRVAASVSECEVRSGWRDEELHSAVMRLASLAVRSDDVSQMHIAELSNSILTHLGDHYLHGSGYARLECGPQLDQSRARDIRDYVYEHLAQQITIDTLAKLAGMTTHHLLIAFRQSFGMTPAQYVIAQRIRRVQWLLLHTSYGITRIAMDTGFASHSHLTSAFRNRTSRTPSEFRAKFK